MDDPSGGITFLFDENTPWRLARSLRELGQAAQHVNDVNLRGQPDEIVLRYAGERGWCILSSDRNILKKPLERAVLKEFNVGAFFLNDTVKSLCTISLTVYRNWPEMKRVARVEEKPFLYLVKERSVLPIRRKHLG